MAQQKSTAATNATTKYAVLAERADYRLGGIYPGIGVVNKRMGDLTPDEINAIVRDSDPEFVTQYFVQLISTTEKAPALAEAKDEQA